MTRTGWLTPKAEVRAAGLKGDGVYALRPIEAGERVAAFGGFVTTREQLASLPDWQADRSLQVDDGFFLRSLELDDPPDLINHSCDANCGFVGGTVLVAMRAIEPGEELSFDDAMSDSDPYDEFECYCGSDRCRGRVRSDAWTDPELQRRYAGFFSSYLQQRIDAALEPAPS